MCTVPVCKQYTYKYFLYPHPLQQHAPLHARMAVPVLLEIRVSVHKESLIADAVVSQPRSIFHAHASVESTGSAKSALWFCPNAFPECNRSKCILVQLVPYYVTRALQ